VSDHAFHWVALLTPLAWFAGRKAKVAVPACTPCRRGDLLQRWGRVVVLFALIIVALAWFYPWTNSLGLSRGTTKLLALMLIAVPGALLWYFWTMIFPRAITLEASSDSTAYQFARAEYATRFAQLNGQS
jgi:hypothetical protein